ncbi:MAG: sugar phosphate isomerase/epimerase [Saprospiraceae bacterium]|nr:sugar phosphate isomerase/epimerase [Saprospiraceae bacterium]
MNRRSFIKNTGLAAGLFSNVENLPLSKKIKMNIKILQTNWGFSGSDDELCKKTKESGYDGLEMWWPADSAAQKSLFTALQKYELEVGFLIGSGEGQDYTKHYTSFEKSLLAASTNSVQKPLYINSHSGRDYYSFDQNSKIIELTINQAKKTGLKILHETHRGRMCFAAHITKAFLEKYPEMALTLDISHWCNVHESLLTDQADTVNFALTRTKHIHARVGHEEGPQINDPRAPEWTETINTHLKWWDKVIELNEAKGNTSFTFLTEFGPPNYMQALPYTRQPVADLWDVNVHMLHLLRKRYQKG